MAFLEIQFPTGISYGSVGMPGFANEVIEFAGGAEAVNQNWSRPREEWNVAFGVKTEADVKELYEFFMVCAGRFHGFRYKNWYDYAAVLPNPIGTGSGALQTFQLYKRYLKLGNYLDRKITKPVAGTTSVYLNGVLQSSGWSIDTTTGVITFTSPPGAGVVVSAAFEFDVPMRFDSDKLPVTLSTYQALSAVVPVKEIKL